VSRQSDDRIAISKPAHERGQGRRIRLPGGKPDGPSPIQGRHTIDLAKTPGTMCAARLPSQRGRHRDHPDPSPHPHDALPWFAGYRFDSWRTVRARRPRPESRRTLVKVEKNDNPNRNAIPSNFSVLCPRCFLAVLNELEIQPHVDRLKADRRA
jgi:hypothetical protein